MLGYLRITCVFTECVKRLDHPDQRLTYHCLNRMLFCHLLIIHFFFQNNQSENRMDQDQGRVPVADPDEVRLEGGCSNPF